ncbi:2OG-Fe(II) oxygenase [Synechococcus phage S-PM2]|uniref:2OG-Fe(II) oxygenase n=1 Tax=Synechococcus phage S-PM2 TaxID=238854 RepID=Q5GQX6_BPSYP|nr:2OG-Fe(II) oxygenase [Synechococcus phage S-PM2]CAF34124.1 2OG-Fe(II) oxygenase [Synechococcus phage S-PM2]CFW42171.1 2OG-Fe(II) oxygenase [Synechococcus phage S-PM2]
MNCNPFTYIDMSLPDSIIDSIYETINQHNPQLNPGRVMSGGNFKEVVRIRDCKSVGLDAQHWFVGMIWHHISRANMHNFQFDITSFDNDNVEFLSYDKGGHYAWHCDDFCGRYSPQVPADGLKTEVYNEYSRKLSFSLLLNDDYEGGEFQIYFPPHHMITIPKEKGKLIIFDSRCVHRVRKVKSGTRDVLVGWVVGPRWK